MAQLKRALYDGADLEESVKTGRMNDQMAVELFIMKYSRSENNIKRILFHRIPRLRRVASRHNSSPTQCNPARRAF